MIFVSIALLVVAAVALGIGIAASAVPPLVVSILATLAAAGTLWASFVQYRKEAAEEGHAVVGLGGNEPRQPGYPDAYTAPQAADAAPAAVPAGAVLAAPAMRGAAHDGRSSVVPAGWDHLPDEDAAEAVEAFNLDELHELRRHEVEHHHRDVVLTRIDDRIDALAAIRRRLSTT